MQPRQQQKQRTAAQPLFQNVSPSYLSMCDQMTADHLLCSHSSNSLHPGHLALPTSRTIDRARSRLKRVQRRGCGISARVDMRCVVHLRLLHLCRSRLARVRLHVRGGDGRLGRGSLLRACGQVCPGLLFGDWHGLDSFLVGSRRAHGAVSGVRRCLHGDEA